MWGGRGRMFSEHQDRGRISDHFLVGGLLSAFLICITLSLAVFHKTGYFPNEGYRVILSYSFPTEKGVNVLFLSWIPIAIRFFVFAHDQ